MRYNENNREFYATDKNRNEVYAYDTKTERDTAVQKSINLEKVTCKEAYQIAEKNGTEI